MFPLKIYTYNACTNLYSHDSMCTNVCKTVLANIHGIFALSCTIVFTNIYGIFALSCTTVFSNIYGIFALSYTNTCTTVFTNIHWIFANSLPPVGNMDAGSPMGQCPPLAARYFV